MVSGCFGCSFEIVQKWLRNSFKDCKPHALDVPQPHYTNPHHMTPSSRMGITGLPNAIINITGSIYCLIICVYICASAGALPSWLTLGRRLELVAHGYSEVPTGAKAKRGHSSREDLQSSKTHEEEARTKQGFSRFEVTNRVTVSAYASLRDSALMTIELPL